MEGQWEVMGGQWEIMEGQWEVMGGKWEIMGDQWEVINYILFSCFMSSAYSAPLCSVEVMER